MAEEQMAFGVIYAKGILKTLGIAIQENAEQTPKKSPKYCVQLGYSQKENADKQLQNAKD